MINGTLQCKTRATEGFDIEGNPSPEAGKWSDYIDCFIQTNTHSNKGTYQDGRFTIAAYTVLIETQPFDADRIKLVTDKGKHLGEFQVQDIQFMDIVGRVKITV